ncbi:MAG TPA: hypothetical protein VGD98_20740 [Ktedonobacteraceae bacterium]
MQQAYQALRVISEAQTVHIVLASWPGALMLKELRVAAEALHAPGSAGVKAVVLDFIGPSGDQNEELPETSVELEQARATVRTIPQPVLALARVSLSPAACSLLEEVDFTLIAHEAELCLPVARGGDDNRIGGMVAARLGYATWSAPAGSLNREMERILDMLRAQSALVLRQAKASVRLGTQQDAPASSGQTQLERLRQVNKFYLSNVMTTQDAREGLKAFLEKRLPRWQNR